MRGISIDKAGITDVNAEAIVNAANESLRAGSGVCGAIFRAAGYEELQRACDEIGHCDTGSAVITPGFRSKAKYIIHAVGPIWHGGNSGEPKKLYDCYRSALLLARENGIHSICFPLISTGVYSYPADEAFEVALNVCREFLHEEEGYDMHIIFAIPDGDKYHSAMIALQEDAPGLIIAVRSNWKALDMPQQHGEFILHRHFSEDEMNALRRGNVPQEMEDKWFWYVEGDTLYAHRSWTGNCIFIIRFMENDDHIVTVNRDPEQYSEGDTDKNRMTLNNLLDWWSQPSYDYYNEWLSETADNLREHGMIRE